MFPYSESAQPQMAVRNQHAVLARRPHRGDVLGATRLGHDAHGSFRRAVEDTVDAAGGASACPAARQRRENAARCVVEPDTGFLLGTCGVNRIFAKDQLQIADFVGPQEPAVLRGCNHHSFALGAGEEEVIGT